MPTALLARRPVTPLERAARQVHADNAPGKVAGRNGAAPPEHGPPVPPESLPPDLLYQRERAYAQCMSQRMEWWLLHHMADMDIRHDLRVERRLERRLGRIIALVPAYVEAVLMARLLYPGSFPPPDVDEEAEEEPLDEGAAMSQGLTVYAPRVRRKLAPPDLPGCQGDGGACPRLRRYGERFCPRCRKVERERMKKERDAA